MVTVAYISGLSWRLGFSTLAAHARRARRRIEQIGDPVDHAREDLVGIGDDPDRHRGALLQSRQIHLEHVGDHPDAIQLADGVELGRRAARVLPLNFGAGVHVAGDHLPLDRRAQHELLRDGVGAASPEEARLLARALALRLGLAVVVLGRLEVLLRAGVRLVELLLALELVLGGGQLGLGLAEIGEGVADVGGLDGDRAVPPSSPARPGRPGCATPARSPARRRAPRADRRTSPCRW